MLSRQTSRSEIPWDGIENAKMGQTEQSGEMGDFQTKFSDAPEW